MSTTVISTVVHELHRVLLDAASGRFPPVDGGVDVVAPMAGDHHAVVEFTGHSFVLTDRDRDDVLALGADGFGGASHPDLLGGSRGPTAGSVRSTQCWPLGASAATGDRPERDDLDDHPRVVRSRHHRRDVGVYGDETGVVTIGRGLVDRLEMSVEVFPAGSAGAGRRLIVEALELVPAREIVFAQVAPGNAASLRAFLSCGFAPIGAETLLLPVKN